jgi:N-acetylmuramic acid 6-phosphate (MurNAc-6-P) etherase
MKKPTEAASNHDDLELMSTAELLSGINQEDQTVASAVQKRNTSN